MRRHWPLSGTSIIAKLLIATVIPALLLFSLYGYFIYETSRKNLDAELGTRLESIAAATATQVRAKYLVDLSSGQEDDRAYQNAKRKLDAIVSGTGVARVYLFDKEGKSLCDTRANVSIGEKYYQVELDRHELSRALASGRAVSSTLFQGQDGEYYKTGYAPVTGSEDDSAIVAMLGVEAPATYFAQLVALRTRILGFGGSLILAVIAASYVVARRLIRPIRNLADAAKRIERGDLAQHISAESNDETGLLARTFDDMRKALCARDERTRMMLAGIAHEIRNPLGGMELFLGILRDELAGDPEQLAHVKRIEQELGHLKQVVDEFLEYARRAPPKLGSCNVLALLSDVRDLALGESARVAIHVEGESALTVKADAGQLRRALLNLVRNAVQATPQGGTVILRVERTADGYVGLQVKDTGKGIPPEELDKVFVPFFTTKEKGTGLGLAFVKEIVRDHNGFIEVTSQVGNGTLFTIKLKDQHGNDPDC